MTARRFFPSTIKSVTTPLTAVFSLLTAFSTTVSNRCMFGCVGTNNKIYLSPYVGNFIIEIDPTNDTYREIDISAVISINNKFAGCQAYGNYIYFLPHSATQVGRLDTTTDVFTLIGTTYTGTFKWAGFEKSSVNGCFYGAPTNNQFVFKFDPTTETSSLIGAALGTGTKYWGNRESTNGKIYCAIYNSTRVLEIDPATDTTTLIGSTYSSSGTKWADIDLFDSDILYCAPFGDNQFLKINASTGSTSLVGNTSAKQLNSIAKGLDGFMWSASLISSLNDVYKFEPLIDDGAIVGFTTAGGYWGAVKYNNFIYYVPTSASQILKITFV